MASIKVHLSIDPDEYPLLHAMVEGSRTGRAAGKKIKDVLEAWLSTMPGAGTALPVAIGVSLPQRPVHATPAARAQTGSVTESMRSEGPQVAGVVASAADDTLGDSLADAVLSGT